MKIALHWFRRDLRVTDNTALSCAGAEQDLVWPVFIFDPKILNSPDLGAARIQFLLESLTALQKNLQHLGHPLIIRHGEVEIELLRLVEQTGATTVYWNRDYEPYARERDSRVEKSLQRRGIATQTCKDGVILEPHEVLKPDGTPYTVYTPYSRRWKEKVAWSSTGVAQLRSTAVTGLDSQPLPTLASLGFNSPGRIPSGGERAALDRLNKFVEEPIRHYQTRRNHPALEGTSKISADLRFGTLSPRQVYGAAIQAQRQFPEARSEIEVYINELIWREFYRAILWHFPQVAERPFKPVGDDLVWENNEHYFAAWCAGRTGYPIVDAGMRQLQETGWMHNRLRMIVASFLTKDLLIDYQWGERYFMQKLVDGDLASNNGGWQWSASTGTDAQPYFRIFSPTSQAMKFDPEGKFIERYVPEVNSLSYPPPIVDHAVQREKALRMFRVEG